MHIVPRDYQVEAVQAIYDYFRAHPVGNPLVAMPTGTGKSVVIAMLLYSIAYHYPLERVLVLTHVKELIDQNFAKFLALWPTAPAGIYSAGLNRRDTHTKFTFAGIASIAKRAAEFGRIGLIAIDEAHLVSDSDVTMYRKFIEELKRVNPHIRVVGFTATPWRLGLGHLTDGGGLFTDVCFDITGLGAFNRLIEEGYLSPLIPKSTTTRLDTDGVGSRGGEFVASDLQKAVDRRSVTKAALEESIELAQDRNHWLFFCSGVGHSEHVAEILCELGVECIAVHGKSKDRDKVLKRFSSGSLRAVANNNVLTTGYDHPGLDFIGVLRPTQSSILWVQMLGRGTRPLYAKGYALDTKQQRLEAIMAGEKQNCLVADFANNTPRLGPINDPVLPVKRGMAKGDAPIKICPGCNTYNHASSRLCCYCGHEFPAPTLGRGLMAAAGTQELIKPDLPVVELVGVDHITYSMHHKANRPPSVKVSYYCGLRMFQEYIRFEHPDQFSRRLAAAWWKKRVQLSAVVPATCAEATAAAGALRTPTHIRVWTNKQYPEIMDYCFDGSAFGTLEPGAVAAPGADVYVEEQDRRPTPVHGTTPRKLEDPDFDIPF